MTRTISDEREHEMSTEETGFAPDPDAELDLATGAGAKIREARKSAGMTQEALAERLRVTQATVSRWEASERAVDVGDLVGVAGALGVPTASLLPDSDPLPAQDDAEDRAGQGGYFAEIAFFGRIEHTGYVTEVVLHGGQAAYHIDLPEKLWGGNPLAWREYAASAFFEKNPVTEESVRSAWEAERERAERWKRQQAEWARAEPRALPAGDGDLGPDERDCGCIPGFTCRECRDTGVF